MAGDGREEGVRGMTTWVGFKRIRIPFTVHKRIGGESKWPIIRLITLALTGITAFSWLQLRFISFAGAGFLIFAIVLVGPLPESHGSCRQRVHYVILLLPILSRIYEEVNRRPRMVTIMPPQYPRKFACACG